VPLVGDEQIDFSMRLWDLNQVCGRLAVPACEAPCRRQQHPPLLWPASAMMAAGQGGINLSWTARHQSQLRLRLGWTAAGWHCGDG
jgi:hypothetical protein